MMVRTNLTYIFFYINIFIYLAILTYYKKGIAWLSSIYVLKLGLYQGNK